MDEHKLTRTCTGLKFGDYNRDHSFKNLIHHHNFEKKCLEYVCDESLIEVPVEPACEEQKVPELETIYHKREIIDEVNPLKPEEKANEVPKLRRLVEIVFAREKLNRLLKKKEWK